MWMEWVWDGLVRGAASAVVGHWLVWQWGMFDLGMRMWAMGKPTKDDFQAQFRGELAEPTVRLRKIGYRVVASDGKSTVLSGLHGDFDKAAAVRDRMAASGIRASVVPAYDWRDFLLMSANPGNH